jgi:hypothetical protein
MRWKPPRSPAPGGTLVQRFRIIGLYLVLALTPDEVGAGTGFSPGTQGVHARRPPMRSSKRVRKLIGTLLL